MLAGSRLYRAADIDRPGVRIAEPKGDSGELYLSRTLQHAELERLPGLNPEAVQKMIAGGENDASATNRRRLTEMAAETSGLRELPDNFFAVEQAIVFAKGKAAAFDFLDQFINELALGARPLFNITVIKNIYWQFSVAARRLAAKASSA